VNTEGINMLTNKESVKDVNGDERCKFKIREIEVWGVAF